MNAVRVAIATSFPVDPVAPRGGVEAVSVNLVEALGTFSDLELHVVTLDRGRQAVSEYAWGNSTVHRLGHRGGRVLLDAMGPGRRQLQDFLRRLRPDVVHSHDTYGLMVKGLAVPRVHTIHGFIDRDTLVAGERFAWLRAEVWRRMERASWADQPHLIAISPYVRERITGVGPGVIHDIENPIALSAFLVERVECPPAILSAAIVCRRKNTLGLVEAFARLARTDHTTRLRLAGAVTEESYAHTVRACIRGHGLEARVDWLGPLSAESVHHELARARVFALVSREENAPLGVAEALAAGLPVVTANRCGMPYMVRHGSSGFLVNPEDPEDIARRLGQILGDPALARAMGDQARQTARRQFHPSAIAERTRAVYLEAIDRTPA